MVFCNLNFQLCIKLPLMVGALDAEKFLSNMFQEHLIIPMKSFQHVYKEDRIWYFKLSCV
jgi:hypothetical protein